jgi:molybdopterin converting factor small subunit
MPEQDVAPSATVTTTGQVEIEAVAWITKFVGGDGSTRKLFCESLRPGDTVRQVLRRLSGRFPELHKALWDTQTGELGEHIEVLVNDAVLDITHSLDSPVHTGDKIALIGQYLGG